MFHKLKRKMDCEDQADRNFKEHSCDIFVFFISLLIFLIVQTVLI